MGYEGINGWENMDGLESPRERPNDVQGWSVCIVANHSSKCVTSLQIFQAGSDRSNRRHINSVELLHLLLGTLRLLPLKTTLVMKWPVNYCLHYTRVLFVLLFVVSLNLGKTTERIKFKWPGKVFLKKREANSIWVVVVFLQEMSPGGKNKIKLETA